jgi:hypothetical protein
VKYVLLCDDGRAAWEKAGETELREATKENVRVCHQISAKGQHLTRCAAAPGALPTSTSVCVRNGRRLVTDGPFAESKEQLGGFYLIDVSNLDD